MAGIYIHIPFCKQACHYCDFHFSTGSSHREEMVRMICRELELQKHYLGRGVGIKTVYFGGGTPSLLNARELDMILNTVHKNYRVDLEELTLEANPDDLTPEKLLSYKEVGIDRLSIGIQSFNDEILKFYNRAHTADESLRVIDRSKKAGFDKLSIDLIYGFPYPTHDLWKFDLEKAIALDPGHISSYSLTIEPNTALGRWTKKGKYKPASDDFISEQFEMMQELLEYAGYTQYEISNFGRPGHYAVHNTSYWRGVPYLGIGPSAHSYNGKNRQFNVANNAKYIKALEKGLLLFEAEDLDPIEAFNEYVLTSLRTIWGTDTAFLKDRYQRDLVQERSLEIKSLIGEGLLQQDDQILTLTKKGKLLADGIAMKLFL